MTLADIGWTFGYKNWACKDWLFRLANLLEILQTEGQTFCQVCAGHLGTLGTPGAPDFNL